MSDREPDALKQALDALAVDSPLDRLAQQLARTVTEQLGAHSCSVWRRNPATGRIGFEFAFEGGKFVTKSDPPIAGLDLWLPMEDTWLWSAPIKAGRDCLIEDIREVSPFPLRDRLVAMGIVTVLMLPMMIAGQLEGAVALRFAHRRPLRADEIGLARTFANEAVLAMQLAQLSAERRDSAVLQERNRMARDIHDTLAQGFTGVIVQLEAAEDAQSRGLMKEVGEHLVRARDLARESLREARRSVLALRPEALEAKDLCQAMAELVAKMTAGTEVRAQFSVAGEPRPLSAEFEENLLHIGRELLTNALRHAGASRFTAQLSFAPDAVRLEARDDGVGFDPSRKSEGFGLLGMGERVARMGGRLEIRSAPREGTATSISVPLP